jgi:putative MATE family efflux protein
LLVGLIVALLFYFGAGVFAWMFGLRGQAAMLAVEYLQIMSWTICLQTFANIGMACLRGAGDAIRPLMVTIGMCLMNGIASPALTFGWWGLPAWGVRGNATGTLLAFAVSGTFTMGFLLRGKGGLRLRLSHLRIVPHLLMRVTRIGMPSWAENVLLWGGQTTVAMLVMKPTDDALAAAAGATRDGVTMAAHGATLRIESLAFLPGFGFAIACSTLVGQFLGARKPEEAQRAAVLCNRLAIGLMTLAALPMVLIPGFLLRLLVDSNQVVTLGVMPLILAGIAQPPFAVAIVKSSALRGAGETIGPMWTTISGMVGRVVLVLAVMGVASSMGHAAWGLSIVWVGIVVDLSYRGLVMEILFRRGNWKTKKV